jgi:peptidoglycan-N-acetylglucosamine deacetylase
MFTFRNVTFLFFLLLLSFNLLGLAGIPVSFPYYLLLILSYVSVSVAASFFICSGFHMNALCRRVTEQKVIAITFDDGPHPVNTPLILDILKDRAKATFFCIGKKIEGNELLLKRMDREGHLAGTHSFSHSNWFDLYSPSRMKKELKRSEELISTILGKKPLLFRPPYGVINPMVKKALRSFSYHVIGFSNRSWDTVSTREKALQRTIRNLSPGDIVLFHDTVDFAPALLEQFLTQAADKGFIVIGLDQLCNIQAYEK